MLIMLIRMTNVVGEIYGYGTEDEPWSTPTIICWPALTFFSSPSWLHTKHKPGRTIYYCPWLWLLTRIIAIRPILCVESLILFVLQKYILSDELFVNFHYEYLCLTFLNKIKTTSRPLCQTQTDKTTAKGISLKNNSNSQ